MLITIGFWFLLFAILSGLGGLALRVAGKKIEDAEDASTAFWLGWASTLALLQLWNLFAPVNHSSFALIALLGSIGLYWIRVEIATARIARATPAITRATSTSCEVTTPGCVNSTRF
jgi:hypothetical protein